MTLGPSYLLKCPKCSKMFCIGSVLSKNNFMSILYSDGKEVGPMMREFPSIIKCNGCSSFFWTYDHKITEEDYKKDKIKQYWDEAEAVNFLTLEELFECLKSDAIRTKKEEFSIRHRIWWTYNDRGREGNELFSDKADETSYRENILQMIQLMNLHVFKFQLITVAEMSRNIGDFESCLLILDDVRDKSLNWVKDKLKEQCDNQNKMVFILR